jgi:hypothetical protein
MKNIQALIIIGVVGCSLSALAAIDVTKLPAASTQQNVTFDKDIKPILEASCTRCHGEKAPKAGINLTTLEGVLKGGKEGKILQVGKSEASLIVEAISQLDPRSSMPPKPRAPRPNAQGTNAPAATPPPAPAKPLTPEQVGLVRAWIDQGAK